MSLEATLWFRGVLQYLAGIQSALWYLVALASVSLCIQAWKARK